MDSDLTPETIAEIEDALALPIGHVRSVRADGAMLVSLSDEGWAMARLGLLEVDEAKP